MLSGPGQFAENETNEVSWRFQFSQSLVIPAIKSLFVGLPLRVGVGGSPSYLH